MSTNDKKTETQGLETSPASLRELATANLYIHVGLLWLPARGVGRVVHIVRGPENL
jgi:hypothetical protein